MAYALAIECNDKKLVNVDLTKHMGDTNNRMSTTLGKLFKHLWNWMYHSVISIY